MKECISCFCCYDDEATVCSVDAGELRASLPGSRLIDSRYRLEKLIARGRMGNIYRASQLDLDRATAVKILHPALVQSEVARERFRREALATAALRHPGIITMLDFGVTTNNLVYLVTEFLEGENLESRLARSRRIEVPEAVRIATEICDALQYAHEQGTIHRNLKPSNIFLVEDRPVERVKVIDFGMVKLTSDSLRSITSGTLIGSLQYAAPEQCGSGEVDARADVYAVGTLLYQMLTGRLPYNAPSKPELVRKKLSQKALPPHLLVFDIPPELEKIVLKAIEIDPEARHQSAAEMLEALRHTPRRAVRETVGLFGSDRSKNLSEQLKARLQARAQPEPNYTQFVSRKRETDRLALYFEQVNEGRSSSVALTGTPGIGKSRLLEEFKSWLTTQQCYTLSGSFTGRDDILETINLAVKLQELFPQDSELERALQLPFSESVFETFAARLLELSHCQPVALLLDSVDRADPVSLEFLLYLMGAAAADRLLLVFAVDLQELVSRDSKTSRWTARLTSLRQTHRLELGPISDADFPELVQKIFGSLEMKDPATELEQLYYATEGNPAQLCNLLKNLVERGAIAWNGRSWVYTATDLLVPDSTGLLIERHLKYLSPQARKTLELASILGASFGFEPLAKLVQVDEERLIETLDELISYQLIEEEEKVQGDERYAMRSPTLERYLYESFSSDERQRLHLQAAAIYHSISKDIEVDINETIAHHFLRGGDYKEGFCRQTAAVAASWREGELERARAQIKKASQVLDRLDILRKEEEFEDARLIDSYCDYLMLAVDLKVYGHPLEAEEMLERALRLAQRSSEPYLTARALVASAHYQQNRGDTERAIGYFERALEIYLQLQNSQRAQIITEKLNFLRARARSRQPTG